MSTILFSLALAFLYVAHFMNWSFKGSFLTLTVINLIVQREYKMLNFWTSHMIVEITEFSNKSSDSRNYSVSARLNIYITCS